MNEDLKPGDKVMFLRYPLEGEEDLLGINWAKKAGLNLMQIYEIKRVYNKSVLLEGREYWHNAELFQKVEGNL